MATNKYIDSWNKKRKNTESKSSSSDFEERWGRLEQQKGRKIGTGTSANSSRTYRTLSGTTALDSYSDYLDNLGTGEKAMSMREYFTQDHEPYVPAQLIRASGLAAQNRTKANLARDRQTAYRNIMPSVGNINDTGLNFGTTASSDMRKAVQLARQMREEGTSPESGLSAAAQAYVNNQERLRTMDIEAEREKLSRWEERYKEAKDDLANARIDDPSLLLGVGPDVTLQDPVTGKWNEQEAKMPNKETGEWKTIEAPNAGTVNTYNQLGAKTRRGIYEGENYQTIEKYEKLLESPAYKRHVVKKDEAIPGASERQKSVMTDEERRLASYLNYTYGEEAAKEYTAAKQEVWNQRIGKKDSEFFENAPALAPLYGIWSGVESFGSGIGSVFTDEVQPISATQYASQYIREELNDDGAWGAIYDIAQSIGNMAPSVLGSVGLSAIGLPGVGAAFGTATMGASSGGNAYAEAKRQGYSDEQARSYGLMIGAAEAGMQYVLGGISKLGSKVTGGAIAKSIQNIDNAMLRVAAQMGASAISEGTEEYLQEIISPIIRNMMLDENNEVQLFSEEAAYSFLLGAVTGGLMEGATRTGQEIKISANTKEIGRSIINSGHAPMLIENAMTLDPESKAYQIAESLQGTDTESISASEVGKLLEAYTEDGGSTEFLSKPVPKQTIGTKAANTSSASVNTNRANVDGSSVIQLTRRSAEYNDSGTPVDVVGIVSSDGDTLTVALSDGSTAPINDISINDTELDAVYGKAANYNTQGAKAFVENYQEGTNVEDYERGFNAMYKGGEKGVPYESIHSVYAQKILSQEARESAYAAGMNAAKAKVEVDTKTAPEAVATPESSASVVSATTQEAPAKVTAPAAAQTAEVAAPAQNASAGVVRNYTGKLNRGQDRSIRAIDAIGKAIGRKINVVDSISTDASGTPVLNEKTGSVTGGTVNAYFDPKTNEYYVALDSSGEAYMYFAMHESVHDIAKNSALGYETLESIVFDVLEQQGADIDALIDVQRNLYPDEDMAYWREEVVANTVPAILTDSKTYDAFMERIVGADEKTRNVFLKMIDAIRDFLRNAYNTLKKEKSWEQMELIENNLDAIEQIRESYLAALEEVAGQDTMGGGAPRMAIKYDNRNTPFVEVEEDILDGVNRKAWLKTVRTNLRKRFPHGIIVGNNVINIDRQSIGEMTYSRYTQYLMEKEPQLFADKMRATNNADEILRASRDYVNEAPLHPRKDNIEQFARGSVLMRIGDVDYTGEVVVAMRNNGSLLLYDLLALEKTTIQEKRTQNTVNSSKDKTGRSSASIDTVSQPDTSVNTSIRESTGDDTARFSMKDSEGNELSEQQAEYFKDSKVRDEDGNLLVMYRGGKTGFTVFDRSKSKYSNLYGRGFYFTDSKAHAGHYGNPRAFYLNIQHPLSKMETTITKEQLRNFLRAVAENEDDYSFENYGYNATVNSVLESVYGKSDFDMLNDINATAIGDLVEAVELFNEINGTDFDGFILSTEAVIFQSNQAKNIDNKNPTTNPDIRFSLKDTSHVDVDALVRKNEQLSETVESLKAQFALTKGHHVSPKAIDSMARRILSEYSSEYNADTLKENLTSMFDYLGNADQIAWDEVVSMGTGMAKAVIEKSQKLDTTVRDQYKDALDYLKKTRITLSDMQRGEVAAGFDSYRNYRGMLFGSTNIGNDGLPLEKAWQELAQMHPDLFDPNVSAGDMPRLLYEAVQVTKPVYVNPYGFDMDAAAQDLFLNIYDQYFGLPEVRTFADKKAAEFRDLKKTYDSLISGFRQSSKERYNAKYKELQKDNLEKRKEINAEYQKAKASGLVEEMADLKKQYAELTSPHAARLLRQKAAVETWKSNYVAKRQERSDIDKYRARIEKNTKKLATWLTNPTDAKHVPEKLRKIVSEFVEAVDFAGEKDTIRAMQWRERMRKLKDAMQRAGEGDSDYRDFYLEVDPDLVPALEAFLDTNDGAATVYDLDVDQLKELDTLMRGVVSSIGKANKMLANERYQNIQQIGTTSMQEMRMRKARKLHGKTASAVDKLLNVDQLDSFSFFDQLGDAAQTILNALRTGFDRKIQHTDDAVAFMAKALKGVKVADMSGTGAKTHTVKLSGNRTIKLTTAQIMELYLLNKREQARGHIYAGGIKPLDTVVKQGVRTQRIRVDQPITVTELDVENIVKVLTDKQKQIADSIQRYMTDEVATWGNETSLQLYGYKKFTEQNYYPIKSDENYTATREPDGATSLQALKNLGMTKATVRNASNPLVLGDIFDTFSQHVNDMSSYNAFVVPTSDAMKWFNYRDAEYGGSVKQSIERILGRDGKQYFTRLIEDINSVSRSEDANFMSRFTSAAKVASVGANLRVVLQQPTAYVRAAVEISPRYLLRSPFSVRGAKMAKKYAPVALWKSWGFRDMNIGKSTRELIVGDQRLRDKIREGSLWLAGQMDELTWGALWNACASEVKATRKDLRVGSEAFNQAVGKRLSQVIDRTQVVDSVFHRSQIMRSNSGLAKMYTSFMSEPTKTYNMLRNAIVELYHNPRSAAAKKKLARTAITFFATALATSAMAALSDASRDDDEELTWIEKYGNALSKNLVDNVNIGNMIPYVKEIVSLMQGFTPSRMDMQGVEKLWNTGTALMKYLNGESKWSDYKLIYESAKAVSSVTGIPIGNMMRTFNSFYNSVAAEPLPMESDTATVGKSYETLYEAITEGDTERAKQLRAQLLQDEIDKINEAEQERVDAGEAKLYMTAADIEAAAKVKVETNLSDPLMDDPLVASAYQYRKAAQTGSLKGIYNQLQAKGFSYNEITRAINKYENEVEGEDVGVEYKDIKTYDAENLVTAVKSGREQDIQTIYENLVQFSGAEDPEKSVFGTLKGDIKEEFMMNVNEDRIAAALDLADKLKNAFEDDFNDDDVEEWLKEAYYDSYEENDRIAQAAIQRVLLQQRMMEQGDIADLEAAAEARVLAADFFEKYPEMEDDFNKNNVINYYEDAQPAGISADMYFEYVMNTRGMNSEKDENGDDIKGKTRKDKVMAYIDSLPLSNSQKDALYYAAGYAESKIGQAPWR